MTILDLNVDYPLQRLWQAVVLQVLADAVDNTNVLRKQQTCYYMLNDPNFYEICNYGNIPACSLIRKFRHKLTRRREKYLTHLIRKPRTLGLKSIE